MGFYIYYSFIYFIIFYFWFKSVLEILFLDINKTKHYCVTYFDMYKSSIN